MIKDIKIADKYIGKQLLETFLMGVIIFTTIAFTSDTFLNILKQISSYGIPFKAILLIIILKLPSILVLTIPMGVLLSTILTYNKLSVNFEITVMKACGISLRRLAMPALIFGLLATLLSFTVSEFITPASNKLTRALTVWAIAQKNLPENKDHFSFKEFNSQQGLKRLFYIDNYANKKLYGITVLDMSDPKTMQIIQSKYGKADPEAWKFRDGATYTISNNGKILNTLKFDNFNLRTSFQLSTKDEKNKANSMSFLELSSNIKELKKSNKKVPTDFFIQLQEKFAMPVTCFFLALIGVPLAITPPRSRFNRGLLFSIGVIFVYYLLRALSLALAGAELIAPSLAVWVPNIVIGLSGAWLLYKKSYKI